MQQLQNIKQEQQKEVKELKNTLTSWSNTYGHEVQLTPH